MKHIILAVSYRAELLEKETKEQEQRVRVFISKAAKHIISEGHYLIVCFCPQINRFQYFLPAPLFIYLDTAADNTFAIR